MSGMYAVYHGATGIRGIAEMVHSATSALAASLTAGGYTLLNDSWFDTITINGGPKDADAIRKRAEAAGINFYYGSNGVSISMHECVTDADLEKLCEVFEISLNAGGNAIPSSLQREVDYLSHEIFGKYRSETDMMRYIKGLENKDLSLMHSMIPLGSCTMKLNAAAELEPISWPGFANLHPFSPADQTAGYRQMITDLEKIPI